MINAFYMQQQLVFFIVISIKKTLEELVKNYLIIASY